MDQLILAIVIAALRCVALRCAHPPRGEDPATLLCSYNKHALIAKSWGWGGWIWGVQIHPMCSYKRGSLTIEWAPVQGHYYTPVVGAYDIWAIRYGYTHVDAAENRAHLWGGPPSAPLAAILSETNVSQPRTKAWLTPACVDTEPDVVNPNQACVNPNQACVDTEPGVVNPSQACVNPSPACVNPSQAYVNPLPCVC
jgi:hypothetical protein